MTCGEVREYLFAFLDNELDAPLSIELQRHLDGCACCAQEAEVERTVQRRLADAMKAGAGDLPAFPEDEEELFVSVSRPVAAFGSPRSIRRVHRSRLIGLAAVVVVGVSIGLVYRYSKSAPAPLGFVDAVVSDFAHFLSEGKAVQIESGDRLIVGDWLRRRTALALALPVAIDPPCRLLGGRKCRIAGRSAAFAAYDMDGAPASLVAMAAEEADLKEMKQIRHEGAPRWVKHRKGFTVVASRRKQLVYVAVARLPEEELFCLVADVVHDGD